MLQMQLHGEINTLLLQYPHPPPTTLNDDNTIYHFPFCFSLNEFNLVCAYVISLRFTPKG